MNGILSDSLSPCGRGLACLPVGRGEGEKHKRPPPPESSPVKGEEKEDVPSLGRGDLL